MARPFLILALLLSMLTGINSYAKTRSNKMDDDKTQRIVEIYNQFLASPQKYYEFFAPYISSSDLQSLKMIANFATLPRATVQGRNKIGFMVNNSPVAIELEKDGFILNKKKFTISIPLDLKKDLADLEDNLAEKKSGKLSSLLNFIPEAHAVPSNVVAAAGLYAVGAILIGSDCLNHTTSLSCGDWLNQKMSNSVTCIGKTLGTPFVGYWNFPMNKMKEASLNKEYRQIVPRNITCEDKTLTQVEYVGKRDGDRNPAIFRYEIDTKTHCTTTLGFCKNVTLQVSWDNGASFNPIRTLKIQTNSSVDTIACAYDLQAKDDKMHRYWDEERGSHQVAISTAMMACNNHDDKVSFEEHARFNKERIEMELRGKQRKIATSHDDKSSG